MSGFSREGRLSVLRERWHPSGGGGLKELLRNTRVCTFPEGRGSATRSDMFLWSNLRYHPLQRADENEIWTDNTSTNSWKEETNRWMSYSKALKSKGRNLTWFFKWKKKKVSTLFRNCKSSSNGRIYSNPWNIISTWHGGALWLKHWSSSSSKGVVVAKTKID